MDCVEEMIMLDYERYQLALDSLEVELAQLPKGNLVYRTINNCQYCHLQHKDSHGVHNSRVPDNEIENMKRIIVHRKRLQNAIKKLRFWISLFSSYTAPPDIAVFADSERPYATLAGDFVRSKSEVIIANALYINKISFLYEKPLILPNADRPIYPDFTITSPFQEKIIYWEHLGLMDDIAYQEKWHRKERRYAAAGISPRAGNLIITQESHNAPFDLSSVMGKIAWLQQQ